MALVPLASPSSASPLGRERERCHLKQCLEARNLGVLEGLLGALTGREPCWGCRGSSGAIGLGFGVPSKPQEQGWGYKVGGQKSLRAGGYKVTEQGPGTCL